MRQNDSQAGINSPALPKGLSIPVFLMGLAFSLLALYVAGFGVFEEVILRSTAVCGAMVYTILSRPLYLKYKTRYPSLKIPLIIGDAVLIGGIIVALVWYFSISETLENGLYFLKPIDNVFALVGVISLILVTYRLFGLPLALTGSLALLYALYGHNLPGILKHPGFTFSQTMRVIWYSFDGVFTRPVAVVISFILVFIVFGAILEGVGAGTVLLKMAFNLTGRLRGGAAHAAIVASGLFGTMSGSVSANVVGTGVFTIPMIKNQGFKASFAGGIEAAASSGGQIMPPVMGAVAFIMADVTGIPYLYIATGALIPALLYYGSLFITVSVEAARHNIPIIPASERPKLTQQDWLLSLSFFIPLLLIVMMLLAGRTTAAAGFWGAITALVMGILLNPNLRRAPWKIIPILVKAGQACTVVLVAVGLVGIIIGTFNMTGLGLRFSSLILAMSGNSLFLALIFMMIGCLILGMGVPTVPAYLLIVLVMGPAIENMGIPRFITHLFVVYYAALSFVTPPVAIGAIVAAPIANAPPMQTALQACRVAFVGFLIPFVLVYNPSLALIVDFEIGAFLWAIARVIPAVWLVATGLAGYRGHSLNLLSRGMHLILALGLLWPVFSVQVATVMVVMVLIAFEAVQSGKLPMLKVKGGVIE